MATIDEIIVGNSPSIKKVKELVRIVHDANANVFLQGEKGVGKTLIAQTIHQLSSRKYKPFIVVNCDQIASQFIEKELFGSSPVPTGGRSGRTKGKLELAQGGSLLLNEITEIPLSLQERLFQAVATGEIMRDPHKSPKKLDVRIMAASNQDLSLWLNHGSLSKPLYYRLGVILIKVPPLRERPGDIDILLSYFLNRFEKEGKLAISGIQSELLSLFHVYHWPGNITELKSLVTRLAISGDWKAVKDELLNKLLNPSSPTIVHSIEFPPEYHQAGVSILNYFGTVLRQKYPDKKVKVRIDQEGLKVTLVIETTEGDRELIERTLDDYGLVITGKMPVQEYTDDKLLQVDLKNQLINATAQIEMQRNLLTFRNEQLREKTLTIEKLFSLVETAISKPVNVSVPVTSISEATIRQELHIKPEISLIMNGLDQLNERLANGSEVAETIKDIQGSVKEIEKSSSPDEVKKSSGMSKLRSFFDDVEKAGSKTGKALKGIRDGIKLAQDLAEYYNSIAQWCGLPQVPKPFLKKAKM